MRGRLALVGLALVGLAGAGVGVAAAATTGGPTANAPAAPATCPAGALRATVLGTDTGVGTTALTIAVTNGSGAACGLTGYPSVQLLDGQGRTMAAAVHPMAVAAVAPLSLAPGGAGSFAVVYRSFDPTSGAPCAPVSALRVDLGGSSVTVPAAFAPCGDAQVSAVSPGQERW